MPNGEPQPYVLLAASGGEYLEKYSGLGTHECLMFLLQLSRKYSEHKLVIFGGVYDFTQILADLPENPALELAQTGRCWWQAVEDMGWVIHVIPGKMFQATPWKKRPDSLDRGRRGSFTVYDVWGFFQASFVRALKEWNVGTHEQRKRILAMKNQRAEFSTEDREQVREYCFEEVRLLVELMDTLGESIYAVGSLPMPRSWHGAGAIADALLNDRYARDFLDGGYPPEVARAYYGGRIETCMVGKIDGPVYEYDINSAYPAALARLPMMLGYWEETDVFDSNTHGVWYVSWDVRRTREGRFFGPFPVRHKGTLWWPSRGSGWYLTIEVDAAIRVFGEGVRVHRGHRYDPLRDLRPWEWIRDLYHERAKLKQEDKKNLTTRNKPLKLALNSLYGKTAQRPNWRLDENGKAELKHGKWRQDYVASYATAATRAALLLAAAQAPESVIGFATDSVMSTELLDLPLSNHLGDWEKTIIEEDLMVVQPGFRMTKSGKVMRTRGGLHTSLGYDDFEREWMARGVNGQLRSPSRRFIALRTAAGLGHVEDRGYWVENERAVTFMPSRRKMGERMGYANRIIPPAFPFEAKGPVESEGVKLPSGKEQLEEWGARDSNQTEQDI